MHPGLHPGWGLAGLGLAWLAGLAGHLHLPALWPGRWHAGLALAGTLLLVAARLTASQRLRRAARVGVGPWAMAAAALLLLALASAGWRAQARLDQRLAPALEGQDLWVTGVVARLPQSSASGLRFWFEVEHAALGRPGGAAVRLPPLLALGWYDGLDGDASAAEGRADLRAGQRWRLPLRLKQPHGALNPHGFDVELMWFEQGLGATGQVRNGALQAHAGPRLLAEGVAHPVERARQAIRDAINRQVADRRVAGVLAALVVGDQSAIEREDWDLFRRTGIAHLVSISGVHVTMLAWLGAAAAGWAWRRSPRLMLWLPAPLAARWLGLALATAYAVLAGWGVPAQRTVLMLATASLLRSGGRHWPWPLVLLAAAVVVTVIDPWALLQPGFWLSFTAVGLLMASEPQSPGRGGAPAAAPLAGPAAATQPPAWRAWAGGLLGDHLRAQVIATLGLAPLSLVFFQQLSLVGFVANLVAIPLVTLLITPLALLGVVLPGLWWLAAGVVQAGVQGLAALAAWPGAVHLAAAPPAWAVACGLIGAALGVLPLPWALRGLALPLLLPLLWPPVARPAWGSVEIVAADVGQGTAVLVRTQHHLLVYDSGPQYSIDSDAGQRVLLPLLQARGEAVVHRLMISHSDSDHVGGAASLVAGLPVQALHTSLPLDHALLQRGLPHPPPHTRCQAGQQWAWDGVQFEVLHPLADDYAQPRKSNAMSCVLRLQDQAGRSILLAGDIEAAQEAALVQRLGPALASTVLLVPHHGSRTSSTRPWLAAVAPQWAVVQAGYRSRYGHPAADVMGRYDEQGITVVRTDRCGAWLWQDGRASCTRDVRRRYWHWTLPAGGAEVANQHWPGLAEPGAPTQ